MISDSAVAIAEEILRERHDARGGMVTHETWNGSTVIEIDELIMKVNDHPSAAAEELITTRLRSAGVPAPEIIDRGRDGRLPAARWIIMRRVSGTSWDASAAGDAEVAIVLDDVSQQLLIMRQLICRGYGWITRDGRGSSPSWQQWLREQVTLRATQLGPRLPADFTTTAADAIATTAPSSFEGSILHGDLGLSHVFVDRGSHRLTGLIDWSNAIIGDPLYDLATFAMGGPAGDPIQERLQPQLVEAYRRRFDGGPIDGRRIQLYRMLHHLNNASWSVDNHVDSWTDDLCLAAAEVLEAIRP